MTNNNLSPHEDWCSGIWSAAATPNALMIGGDIHGQQSIEELLNQLIYQGEVARATSLRVEVNMQTTTTTFHGRVEAHLLLVGTTPAPVVTQQSIVYTNMDDFVATYLCSGHPIAYREIGSSEIRYQANDGGTYISTGKVRGKYNFQKGRKRSHGSIGVSDENITAPNSRSYLVLVLIAPGTLSATWQMNFSLHLLLNYTYVPVNLKRPICRITGGMKDEKQPTSKRFFAKVL